MTHKWHLDILNWYFFSFALRSASLSSYNTAHRCLRWCSTGKWRSWRHVHVCRHWQNLPSPASRLSTITWKVAGAPISPNGIRLNWNSPNGIVNAVFTRSLTSTGICQYPWVRSTVLMYLAPRSWSIISSTLGMGYSININVSSQWRHALSSDCVIQLKFWGWDAISNVKITLATHMYCYQIKAKTKQIKTNPMNKEWLCKDILWSSVGCMTFHLSGVHQEGMSIVIHKLIDQEALMLFYLMI